MTITYSDFLDTIAANDGEVLATVGGKAAFRVEKSSTGVHFTPVRSGNARTVNAEGIQEYLDVFNATQSFKTTSYTKSMFNPSYVLAVIQLWVGQQQADTPPSPEDRTLDDIELGDEFSAPEGNIKVRSHRQRERSRELVTMAKKAFRIEHQRLFCEVCSFDFGETYGEPDFIEAHHRIPLCDLQPGMKTKLSDLAMVCANCHRMLHRGNPWPTVGELREKIPQKWMHFNPHILEGTSHA